MIRTVQTAFKLQPCMTFRNENVNMCEYLGQSTSHCSYLILDNTDLPEAGTKSCRHLDRGIVLEYSLYR